jgi:hypothetical protein
VRLRTAFSSHDWWRSKASFEVIDADFYVRIHRNQSNQRTVQNLSWPSVAMTGSDEICKEDLVRHRIG